MKHEPRTSTFLSWSNPSFTESIQLCLSGGTTASNWPSQLAIGFGLTRDGISLEPGDEDTVLSLQPWVTIVASHRKAVSITQELSTDVRKTMDDILSSWEKRRPLMIRLGHLIRQKTQDGIDLPTEVVLTPFDKFP